MVAGGRGHNSSLPMPLRKAARRSSRTPGASRGGGRSRGGGGRGAASQTSPSAPLGSDAPPPTRERRESLGALFLPWHGGHVFVAPEETLESVVAHMAGKVVESAPQEGPRAADAAEWMLTAEAMLMLGRFQPALYDLFQALVGHGRDCPPTGFEQHERRVEASLRRCAHGFLSADLGMESGAVLFVWAQLRYCCASHRVG